MLLTPEQIKEIQQIISDYHDAFIANAIDPEAIDPEVLQRLKDVGLIDEDIKSVQEAYIYGQLVGTLQNATIAAMGYKEFKDYIQKNPVPLSAAEKHAMALASMSAGQYCKGLGNRVNLHTGQVAIEVDGKLRARMEETIQTTTAEAIEKRKSVKQLKSDLGWATKDWARDWERIAVTELNTALQHGVADNYRKTYGEDVLVAKRVMPGACPHCKRLYLDDGGNPIVFKLSSLEANGTNVGKKVADWQPVVGSLHPNCFTKGVRILTSKGEKLIEDLLPGDQVLTNEKRWRRITHIWESEYKGQLANIKMDNGIELPVTANHPLLSTRGFLVAKDLNTSDELLGFGNSDSFMTFFDLYSEKQPTMVRENQLFASVMFGFSGSGVPVTAIYFDGQFYVREGQINVNGLNGEIGDRIEAGFSKTIVDKAFVGRFDFTEFGLGSATEGFKRIGKASHSDISFSSEGFSLFQSRFGITNTLSSRNTSGNFTSTFNSADNSISSDSEMSGYVFYRHQLIEVQIEDGRYIQFNPSRSVISGHVDYPFNTVPIASVNLSEYDGIVYNITVEEDHTFLVNGIVSHNCQCQIVRVPAGWGWDEDGSMVPGGKATMAKSMAEWARILAKKAELKKAFSLQGSIKMQGLDIGVENKKGSNRTWHDPSGNSGETKMQVPYGYIKGTVGDDGEEIDCFVGQHRDSKMVYLISQQNSDAGTYDEKKVMLGFLNQNEAVDCYYQHYDVPEKYFLEVMPMEMDQFQRMIFATKNNASNGMVATGDVVHTEKSDKFVIPLEKGIANAEAAYDSPMGNRNVVNGGVANYLFNAPPRKPRKVGDDPELAGPTIDDMLIKDLEDQAKLRETLKRDKKIYDVKHPTPAPPKEIKTPDYFDQSVGREGMDQNRETLKKWRIKNSGIGNPADIGSKKGE